MPFDYETMKITPAVYKEVTAIKFELQHAAGRKVTYSEALQELARTWRATQALVEDARAAGQ